MYNKLAEINIKPKVFETYTADMLWTDEHISKNMLEYHLNKEIDAASRNILFIDTSVDWIVEHFNLGQKSKVIDFGCGPGLYTTRFARKEIEVTGIDFSSRSIEYAKHSAQKENLDIEYINENYLDYNPNNKYDLVTMIMCDYCALSPNQRKLMLKKFKEILKEDGHVFLDVYSLNSFSEKKETAVYEKNQMHNFWAEGDYYCFLNTFKYDEDKVSLDKYTIFENGKEQVIYNWLQYFDKNSLEKEFVEAGFEIKEYFSDVTGKEFLKESDEFAITAVVKK